MCHKVPCWLLFSLAVDTKYNNLEMFLSDIDVQYSLTVYYSNTCLYFIFIFSINIVGQFDSLFLFIVCYWIYSKWFD